jgi:cation transport regulator ChaB
MREGADEARRCLTLESLPPAIRADLPPHLQELYVDTFNNAWRQHADFADREPFCHRVARSAIKRHQRSLAAPLREGASAALSREIHR